MGVRRELLGVTGDGPVDGLPVLERQAGGLLRHHGRAVLGDQSGPEHGKRVRHLAGEHHREAQVR